jgi:hypothetical protein
VLQLWGGADEVVSACWARGRGVRPPVSLATLKLTHLKDGVGCLYSGGLSGSHPVRHDRALRRKLDVPGGPTQCTPLVTGGGDTR